VLALEMDREDWGDGTFAWGFNDGARLLAWEFSHQI
jgi:hypothetical protein